MTGSGDNKSVITQGELTQVYVIKVILAIHRFMITAVKMLCTDIRVQQEIWSSILEEVLDRYRAAMNQARFLVSTEREKRPYTLNHYLNEELQISRDNRMAALLELAMRILKP